MCRDKDISMFWYSLASLRVRLTIGLILAVLPPCTFILWLQNTQAYSWGQVALFAIAAIALGWVGSELLLLRWVRVLTQASEQLAVGDLKVRINDFLDAPIEIRQLAQSFNHMAAFLEQQLTQLQEELQESEQQFRQIAENICDVLWVYTPGATQAIYINPTYEKMWGRTCESLYAQPRAFVEGIHPEDRDRVIAFLDRRLTLADSSLEYRVVRPDGAILWVQSRSFSICNQAGEVYRVAGLIEDITLAKQTEAEIRQLNETLDRRVRERTAQLEATNKELDAFSYSVSHDLRAPLRHISGFVDALAVQLEKSNVANPKIDRYIEVIQGSCEKMGLLIDGLLTLSRVGRQQLEDHPINLRKLVDAAIALVNDDHSIEFIVGDLPIVRGDPALLQQVFTNLIDNAVKFSCVNEAAGKQVHKPARIEIAALPDGTIFIKDNGVGFQMEYADQLFGAFQRLHSQREFKGTGIGLAIVQRIIHRHSGIIWAESAPNAGATFYFKLKQMPEGRS